MNWGRMFSYIYFGIGAYSALILAAEIIIIIFGGRNETKTVWYAEEQKQKEKKKDCEGKVNGRKESKD